MNILLVYGTTEGQTRKIADFVAAQLRERHHQVIAVDAAALPADLDPRAFDAVLIAASLHFGHYQSAVVHFVKAHLTTIDAKPNAFLSVSLAAASDDPDDLEGLRQCDAAFVARTQWSPGRIHHATGAFRYTEYDFFKRWALKYIAARRGAPTDTSRDHELTDWQALADFAESFAAGASEPAMRDA